MILIWKHQSLISLGFIQINNNEISCPSNLVPACRFIYNYFLRQRIDYYLLHKDDKKKGLTYIDTVKMLTKLKKQEEFAWTQEVITQSLQQTLNYLDRAYNSFFNKKTKFPTFKKKKSKQSFAVFQYFYIRNGKLVIPKLSPIKIKIHREIEGEMRHITISKTPTNKYFVSIMCLKEISAPQNNKENKIGIDLGLKSFLATSNREKVENPKYLIKAEKQLQKFQRQLSKKVKGSFGFEKVKLKIARQYEKVVNCRKDFLHKLSHRLVNENQVICAENLNIKGMLSNHKLAKHIGDACWGEFLRQLEYKSKWYGCELNLIDRFFPSSKRCNICGWINENLKLSNREWLCPSCNTLHDRDINASINILNFNQIVGREPPEFTPEERQIINLVETGNGQRP